VRTWTALAVAIVLGSGAQARPEAVTDPVAAAPSPQPLPEYNVKAAFLVQFFNFVRWPEGSPAAQAGTTRIGIVGESPFGDLFRPLEGTMVLGRPLEIKVFRTVEEIEACHILFVAASEEGRIGHVLAAVGKASTLTVSDSPEFVRLGGMIRFHHRESRIALEINNAAAERVGLKLSAKLLDLAARGRAGGG
jgi:hypothetical protein